MNKQQIDKIKNILRNRKRVFFDINTIDESVVVDVKDAPGYEFKVNAIIQKNGKILLEVFPYRQTGAIEPIKSVKEYELCEIPLEDVLDTHNGPQEILESLEILL